MATLGYKSSNNNNNGIKVSKNALKVLCLAVCLAFMNLIARLILNMKCEIAVFTSVIVLCVLNQI